MNRLEEIEAIKQLKYRYFRFVDLKQWEDLEGCFIPDATSSYRGGKYSFQGARKIVGFIKGRMEGPALSMHHGHHPEIELTGPDSAKGIWALQDYVIDLKANVCFKGAGFYQDEYVKVDGQWKIKHTGYRRTFEEIMDRGDVKSLRLRESMLDEPKEEG